VEDSIRFLEAEIHTNMRVPGRQSSLLQGTGIGTDAVVQLAVPRASLLAATSITQVQFSLGAPMRSQVVCSICDKTEHDCLCEKYCTNCKGQYNVHLCSDGLYYCPECREACDVSLAENRVH